MLRRTAKQMIVAALLLLLFCAACRLTVFREYRAWVALPPPQAEQLGDGADLRAQSDAPDVAAPGGMTLRNGILRIPVRPGREGRAEISVLDANGDPVTRQIVRVGRFGTVFDASTGGFTGDTAVMIATTLFWLLSGAVMLWHYTRLKGPDYYTYASIYYAGFSLFSLVTGLTMLRVTVVHIADPAQHSMLEVYETINGAGMRFMMLTLPVMTVAAAALAVSNIVLLRHQKPHPQNLLSLGVSFVLLAGEALGVWLYTSDFSGPEQAWRIRNTLQNAYAAAFAYFECMLAGAVICSTTAARRRPGPDRDFIVVLGCWFREDGSLPPLLKGRVDAALDFWHAQKEKTGKEAILIPCGGRGKDEPIPEAEAMRRYLREKEVPERFIRTEDRSVSTYENMANARAIVEEINPEGKTAFATTSYHVFRSGLWAAQAGLRAEGIGGKTRWWFWPNAFLRECAGLMHKRWRQELALLGCMLVYFTLLSVVLG